MGKTEDEGRTGKRDVEGSMRRGREREEGRRSCELKLMMAGSARSQNMSQFSAFRLVLVSGSEKRRGAPYPDQVTRPQPSKFSNNHHTTGDVL
ncbi:hypothetical protein Pcinc_038588 [Petrolisthes cinctipes]|uniref:Uncharacterized protein n=1 Tax=Petrolisthes cinctipes TaxID=88211 RepID=A0AAE1BTF1_PETCI|nr:hypothetical protein Pcinc_038588 [Petrolisthes cinctipes]